MWKENILFKDCKGKIEHMDCTKFNKVTAQYNIDGMSSSILTTKNILGNTVSSVNDHSYKQFLSIHFFVQK